MSWLNRCTLSLGVAASFAFGSIAFAEAPAATRPSTRPAAAAAAPATQPAGLARFMRFVDDGKGGGRLETADVVYRNKDGVTVHLVSAVHIGEQSYFQALADSFKAYDAVLYEMVKPQGVEPPGPGERTGSGVSDVQRLMKDLLDLQFQLDVIDYTQPNFVHADLDAETFQQLQAERGESFVTLFLNQMMRALSQPMPGAKYGPDDPMNDDLMTFMTRPDGIRQVKLILARQMGELEQQASGFGLEGTVILTERNKAALKKLKQTIDDGKKNLALYYGAAHMPDLADTLELMGFEPVATEWRQAWDLTIRKGAPSLFQKLFEEALKAQEQAPVEQPAER